MISGIVLSGIEDITMALKGKRSTSKCFPKVLTFPLWERSQREEDPGKTRLSEGVEKEVPRCTKELQEKLLEGLMN